MKSKLLAIALLCAVAYIALNPTMLNQVTHAFSGASQASKSLTTSLAPIVTSTNGDYSVVGKPTITAAHINIILQDAHSPAQGTGTAMYAYGVAYGIDPIFALAFFQHESTFGTAGQARANLGIGNIRCTPGYTCINGYRAYSSWPAGMEDWYKLIRYQYVDAWKLQTVNQIVPTYAPSADRNNPTQYIVSVESSVSLWRGENS